MMIPVIVFSTLMTCRVQSVRAPSYPDLVLYLISWTPSSPKVGDTISFTVYIENQGTVDTSSWGSFDVQAYIDGSNVGEWIIDNIPARSWESRQFLSNAIAGDHTVGAYADHGGFIPESNEANNERTEAFTVGPSTKVLQIDSLGCPSGIIVNQGFTLNVDVGYFLTTTNIAIQVYENGGPLLGHTQDILSGSGGKTYPFGLTAPSTPRVDWQLNIHLFYWDGEWIQSDVKSVHIIVNDEPILIGDVNFDGKVDVKDVYKVALAYGSSLEGPNPPGHSWDPNCDINVDNKVDVKDYYIVCKHYGEVGP